MNWVVAMAAAPGLLVSLVLANFLRSWAPRWGLVDQPGHRKVHERPVPFGGGLAIWAGVVLPLSAGQLLLEVWQQSRSSHDETVLPAWLGSVGTFVEPHLPGLLSQSRSLWFFLAAGTVLMLLGLIDDARRLDWRFRMAVQFLVAGTVVLWQGWKMTLYVDMPVLTDLVSVLWIVGLINSFNFLDNMDGLAGGVAAIAAALLARICCSCPKRGIHNYLSRGCYSCWSALWLGFYGTTGRQRGSLWATPEAISSDSF